MFSRKKKDLRRRYIVQDGESAGRRASDEFGAQAEESIGENRASDGLRHLFAMHMPPDEAGLRIGSKNRSGEKFLRRAQPANFVLICGGGEDV